jgi:hypothetical protein
MADWQLGHQTAKKSMNTILPAKSLKRQVLVDVKI